jgi:hypothetical protein
MADAFEPVHTMPARAFNPVIETHRTSGVPGARRAYAPSMNSAVIAAAIGVGGTVIVGVAGFWASVRNTNKTIALALRTVELTQEGQVTDRYAKAVEQLGSDKLDVRIGGIYALERVACDWARDHPTVMEVLTAFVRERSLEQWSRPADDVPGTRPDIQAALTVIGRRTTSYDREPRVLSINLAGAELPGANLTGANLWDVNLSRANLTGAHLDGAILGGGAHLDGAHWPVDAVVPQGWQRDTDSGPLKRADTGRESKQS